VGGITTRRRPRRLAVVGLGNVAVSHLEAYSRLNCVELTAVVEARADRRRLIAEQYRVPGFANLEELLPHKRPEIACILTPAATHRALTVQCAQAGIHVLCEKPMAVDLTDALAMARACDDAHVAFFYGSSYRFLPAVQEARRLIGEGALGNVRVIVEQALGGRGPEAYQALSAEHYPPGGPGGGGWGLVDHGIHMLDIFPWVTGCPIRAVFGSGCRSGGPANPEYALLQMEGGAIGILLYDQSTWPLGLPSEGAFSQGRAWVSGQGWVGESGNWDPHPGEIRVHGTDGSVRILHYANRLFLNRQSEVREIALPPESTPWHFGRQLEQFCLDLDDGSPPSSSAQDGIRALSTLLAIYESEERKGWSLVQQEA
jgi:UDP-N-acetyl-2-amino-2-deoxyglucuronate dehydrogenase